MPEGADGPTAAFLLSLLFAALSTAAAICRYGVDSVPPSDLVEASPPERRSVVERILGRLDRVRLAILLVWVTSDTLLVLTLHEALRRVMGGTDPLAPTLLTVTVLVAAPLLVVLGRLAPRGLARRDLERRVAAMLPHLDRLAWSLWPAVRPLLALRRRIDRALREGNGSHVRDTFEDEVIAVVERGEREGAVAEEEADMISNVVSLREFEVSEIMTPRTDVKWIRHDASLYEALRFAGEVRHSRIPVAKEDCDHVEGIFYIRDVVDKLPDIERLKSIPVKQIARKAYFVPETKPVAEMLKEFRARKIQIAIVVDEYGGTAGLVTIEDVLEEIVGEIVDEYDDDDAEPLLRRLEDGSYEVDARWHIEEINEKIGTDFPEEGDFDTLGGFVFTQLGRIPAKDEEMRWNEVRLRVLDADERRVRRLAIELRPAEVGAARHDGNEED